MISTSQFDKSAASTENGIESVKKSAPEATIVDLTQEEAFITDLDLN